MYYILAKDYLDWKKDEVIWAETIGTCTEGLVWTATDLYSSKANISEANIYFNENWIKFPANTVNNTYWRTCHFDTNLTVKIISVESRKRILSTLYQKDKRNESFIISYGVFQNWKK